MQVITACAGPKDYYSKVWMAEKSIIGGNISSGRQYYRSAFEQNSPLKRDVWNALACELLLEKSNKSTVQKYILWCVEMDKVAFFENMNPEKKDRVYTDWIIFTKLNTSEYLPFISSIDKKKNMPVIPKQEDYSPTA